MVRRLAYLAAATLAAATVAEPAGAASWRTLLTAEAHLREPAALVGDGDGGALLAWVDFAGDRPTVPNDPQGPSALWAAWRAPGGELSEATRVTSPAERPRALAGSGDAAAVSSLPGARASAPPGTCRWRLDRPPPG
jgi:hypothetical protein